MNDQTKMSFLSFVGLASVAAASLTLGAYLLERFDPLKVQSYRNVSSADFQRGNPNVIDVMMTPRNIRIVVMESDAYRRQHPGSFGATYSRSDECLIHLPAGWMITAELQPQKAKMLYGEDADTLVHEILHCYRPDWHDASTLRRMRSMVKGDRR